MTTYLKVTVPFENFNPGDVIDDQTIAANVQADTAFNGKYVAVTTDPRVPASPGNTQQTKQLHNLGYIENSVTALTDAATITLNAALSPVYTVTLGGNRTLANPTNLNSGMSLRFSVIVKQDGTGSRTLAYGTNWKFAGGAPTLSTAANTVDRIDAVWDGTRLTADLKKAFA